MKNKIVLIWEDEVALSIAAAHYFVEACNKAIALTGKFTIALSGGNTPKLLYQMLASPAFSVNIDWKKVFIFWSDERFVAHTNDDSNYKMAKENLLNDINIPKKNIFSIPTKGKPKDCALSYEQKVKDVLGRGNAFDLILLGMGDDGHTASLFPTTEILKEKKRLVKEVWVDGKQTWRISFTYPLINAAKEIMFLIAGAAKAPILKKVLKDKSDPVSFPVEGVSLKRGNITWLVDSSAFTK